MSLTLILLSILPTGKLLIRLAAAEMSKFRNFLLTYEPVAKNRIIWNPFSCDLRYLACPNSCRVYMNFTSLLHLFHAFSTSLYIITALVYLQLQPCNILKNEYNYSVRRKFVSMTKTPAGLIDNCECTMVLRNGRCRAVHAVQSSSRTWSCVTLRAAQTYARCQRARCLTWENLSGARTPRSVLLLLSFHIFPVFSYRYCRLYFTSIQHNKHPMDCAV